MVWVLILYSLAGAPNNDGHLIGGPAFETQSECVASLVNYRGYGGFCVLAAVDTSKSGKK